MSQLTDGTLATNATYASGITATATGIAKSQTALEMLNDAITPWLPIISLSLTVLFFIISRYQSKKAHQLNAERLEIAKREDARKEEAHQAQMKLLEEQSKKLRGE